MTSSLWKWFLILKPACEIRVKLIIEYKEGRWTKIKTNLLRPLWVAFGFWIHGSSQKDPKFWVSKGLKESIFNRGKFLLISFQVVCWEANHSFLSDSGLFEIVQIKGASYFQILLSFETYLRCIGFTQV